MRAQSCPLWPVTDKFHGENLVRIIMLFLAILFSATLQAADKPVFPFTPDANVATEAGLGAEVFVKLARDLFSVELDYSDASIERVEQIAQNIQKTSRDRPPSNESVMRLSYAMGGYIGETLRRNHEAEWGVMLLDGQRVIAMRIHGNFVWPTGKAEKRIRNGQEDDIWFYYQVLLKKIDDAAVKDE
jgi:hypothetical protein